MSNDIDIHALLAERQQIAIVWSVEDVQELFPELTDDDAWQVLQAIERNHDCNHGVTWDLLDWVASQMFPTSADDAGKSAEAEGKSPLDGSSMNRCP